MKINVLKKIIIFALLIIFISTSGALCNPGPDSKKKEEIVLTFWNVFDDPSVFKEAIEYYKYDHPNIKINYVEMPYEEYEKESVNAIAAGTGPDIWSIRYDWVDKQYDKLIPMTKGLFNKGKDDTRSDIEIYQSMFPDVVSEENIINDQIYGLPLSVDTLLFYYNKKHFKSIQDELYKSDRYKEAELFVYTPNTWEDFIAMSKILTKKDANGNIIQSGASLGTAKINNAVDILTVLMLQNNTQMTSADRLTATFNLPISRETGEPVYAGTEALKFYTSFSSPEKETYSWNDALGDSVNAFMQGKVSIMINYAYQQQRIAQEAPTLSYGTGPLPQVNGSIQSTDYASYWTETVTNNSEHPKEAWLFIQYLYKNYLSSYQSITKKPSPKRINELEIPETKLRVSSGYNPLKFQIMTAKPYDKGKYPQKVDDTFAKMIDDVTLLHEPFQKAIDTAAATVTNFYQLSQKEPEPTTTTKK